jgi:hypothetical protein
MTVCKVIPFPARHRVAYIRNVAHMLASYRPAAAERTFAAQMEVQRNAMLRRGIAPEAVEREVRMLEQAVRAAFSNLIMFGGDAA